MCSHWSNIKDKNLGFFYSVFVIEVVISTWVCLMYNGFVNPGCMAVQSDSE